MGSPGIITRANGAPLRVAVDQLSPEMRAAHGLEVPAGLPDPGPGEDVLPAGAPAPAAVMTPGGLAEAKSLNPAGTVEDINLAPQQAQQPEAAGAAPPSAGMTASQQVGFSGAAPPAADLGSPDFAGLRRLEKQQAAAQKENAGALKTAVDAEKNAIQAKAEVDAWQQDEAFRLQRRGQEQQDAMLAREQRKQAWVEQRQQHQMSKVQDLMSQQAATAFDPERFMKSAGPAGQALAAVSIAIGAMAQAYTHGENPGLRLIQDAINRDIMGQKEQYEQRQQGISNAQNVYAQLRQQGLDEVSAMAGARMAANERTKNQVAMLGAKYGGDAARANAAAVSAALDKDSAQHAQVVTSQEGARALQMFSTREGMREFDINKQMQERAQDIDASKVRLAATQKYSEENRKRYVPGVGLAIDEDSAKKLREAHEAHSQGVDALNTIIDVRRKSHGSIFETVEPKLAGRLQVAAETVRHALQRQQHLGVLSEQEYQRLVSQVPDPTVHDFTERDLMRFQGLLERANAAWDKSKGALLDPSEGYKDEIVERRQLAPAKPTGPRVQ